MPRTLTGACHCGRVTFEVDADPTWRVDCNCSLCYMRGALWHGVADANLRILTGENELQLYEFNTRTAKHYFCRHCGIHPFTRPRLDPSRWAVNLRCVEGVDPAKLDVIPFDGQNWEQAAEDFRRARS